MANVLIPKKSTVAAKVPTTSDLALGEIAINHADKKLYARHPSSGVVQSIGAIDQYDVQSAFAAPYSYIGRALKGTATNASDWTITRIEVASDGTTTTATASGAWTNRASLSYS